VFTVLTFVFVLSAYDVTQCRQGSIYFSHSWVGSLTLLAPTRVYSDETDLSLSSLLSPMTYLAAFVALTSRLRKPMTFLRHFSNSLRFPGFS